MPYVPDRVVNRPAKIWQALLIAVGVIFIISGVLAFFDGDGTGLGVALLGGGLTWLGSKIKTTHNYKGGTGIYK
tara:strand:- start:7008 stop:7229 length:222 start_codon:yes stop_codon:yes gene_type:complete